jgi:hypothetical protein
MGATSRWRPEEVVELRPEIGSLPLGERKFKREELPLLIDAGAELSCIRRVVLKQLARSGEKFF